MSRSDASRGLLEDLDDPPPGGARLLHPRPEGLADDELHRHPDLPAMGAHIVHRDDVWMAQLAQRLGLTVEARPRGLIAAAADQLEGHVAIQLRVVRRIDDTHPPRAEGPQDGESTDRRSADQLVGDT